jgi:pimeloyl-ACP methyl ester carboxylesterase
MKVLQWLATVVLVLAGVLLLVEPVHAQAVAAKAFAPTRFTITDAGTFGKPDVVLIPGLASSSAVWDAEAKLLAPNYRLHVVQVDGFAGAPVGGNAVGPILPGIVEELHGLLTLMLADKYPGDVRKMVIVDTLPFYGLVFNPDATVELVAPQAKVIGDQILAIPADQFAEMQPVMVQSMVKDDAGAKAVAASSIASDRKTFVAAMMEDLGTDLRPDLAKIKTPTLLLYPYDPTLQKDEAKYDAVYKDAYAAMPNVTLFRIDGSRHFIMYDQPARLDAALEGFLK